MHRRAVFFVMILLSVIMFSGCGKIVEEITYGEFVPSPIPGVCNENTDCRLTNELYDPCGSIHSIHVRTAQSVIDEYNRAHISLSEGVDYDCNIPPSIHEYVSMCHQHVCVSAKIE
ncbi:MAG TPA: hypothetical protein PK295_01300 [Candidatus Magasanikbacteria bacterium]|nr:hypothetical protein [Candidatus Magasanikbacteria bacterium]